MSKYSNLLRFFKPLNQTNYQAVYSNYIRILCSLFMIINLLTNALPANQVLLSRKNYASM